MTTPNQAGKAQRILVVDDDPISLELLALLLGSEGHSVTTAANGKEALNALVQTTPLERPTAILVDLKMPGLSGDELARLLRSQLGRGGRILAMSASAPSSTASFDGFLLKPLNVELLNQMLDAGDALAASPPDRPAGDEERDSGALDERVFARLQSMMPRRSVEQIYEACIDDVRKRLPEMAELLNSGDSHALQGAAHTIKGGSSMIGASRLSQVAAKIEIGFSKPDEDRELLKELSSACDELERILLERNDARHWG